MISFSEGKLQKLSSGKFNARLTIVSSTTYCVFVTVNEKDFESSATVEVVQISLSRSTFKITFDLIAELTIEWSFKNLIHGLNFLTSHFSGLK